MFGGGSPSLRVMGLIENRNQYRLSHSVQGVNESELDVDEEEEEEKVLELSWLGSEMGISIRMAGNCLKKNGWRETSHILCPVGCDVVSDSDGISFLLEYVGVSGWNMAPPSVKGFGLEFPSGLGKTCETNGSKPRSE